MTNDTRYFNITAITTEASYSHSQFMTDNLNDAENRLRSIAHSNATEKWCNPLVYAAIFDTKLRKLTQYSIDTRGNIHLISEQ